MDSLDPHPARRPPFEWTAALVQTALALGVAGLLAVMASNMLDGLARQGISPTFDFLRQQAGFSISETWVELPERSSYWQVLSAGLANTVWVSVWGIFLATGMGVVVGMSALSPHFLLSRLARGYVELIR
ncbi:MAG: amino acid ABC transporter permease, partial [Deltaproteobacteria bacterium]|nr:amino acid ABC transporter permease [Deltaproteobacteria bacterium]